MRKTVSFLLLMLILVPQGFALSGQPTQVTSDPAVEAILEQMSVEERVGQLFVITYKGTDVDADSEIAALIQDYHIGGVVLLVENDNFSNIGTVPEQVYGLTEALQSLADSPNDSATPVPEGPFVPLYIGLEHDGTGGISRHLQSGLSALPSNMALGATWDPTLAEATGSILGEELAALGINLLIGPSAGVVEDPHPSTSGDWGTTEFGGEPYWVSEMVSAYVRGLHQGSNERIAVFPRYFPGHGGADRNAIVEIPSIQRSLDVLQQKDLKPFFAITGSAEDPIAQADGLITGHIRYRGFRGDSARLETDPISLDQQNLLVLLQLEQIAAWHAQGGLIMSDALGVRGIANIYAPDAGSLTPYRGIALDALLAGNDILYLGKFDTSVSLDENATIRDTITFLVDQYGLSPDVKARVDEAVRRILRAKLDLYGADTFVLSSVTPPRSALAALGTQDSIAFNVAQRSLTLISPSRLDLLDQPDIDDQIVIFTDSKSIRQCSSCPVESVIPIDSLQALILRQYGPLATGQVSYANIHSFSFDDLQRYYNQPQGTPNTEGTPQPNDVGAYLDSAEWVVFVMVDISPTQTPSVVKQYLASNPTSNTVVFAMGAPYYLDATEVGKLYAYYALYGASDPFIEVAARALFLGLSPRGYSPVSINAIGYRIFEVTSPDPNGVITLEPIPLSAESTTATAPVDLTLTPAILPSATPTSESFQLGDTIIIKTGIIRDLNGNPVPDGTPVQFKFDYEELGLRLPDEPITTIGGVAEIRLRLDQIGTLFVTATSAPATFSDELRFEITSEEVEFERNTPEPVTATPSMTETEESRTGLEATPTATPVPPPPPPVVEFGDLYLTLFGLVFFAGIVFAYGYRERDLNYGLLLAMPVVIGGLLVYNYYAMLLPGSGMWRDLIKDRWAAALAAWVGGLLGLGVILLLVRGGLRWLRKSLRDRR